jgi:hypothetical protein
VNLILSPKGHDHYRGYYASGTNLIAGLAVIRFQITVSSKEYSKFDHREALPFSQACFH